MNKLWGKLLIPVLIVSVIAALWITKNLSEEDLGDNNSNVVETPSLMIIKNLYMVLIVQILA